VKVVVKESHPSRHHSRPRRVILLVLFALLLGTCNAIRLGQTINFWQPLEEYGTNNETTSLAISGAIWMIVPFIAATGLWRGKKWSWYLAVFCIAGYATWILLERLVFQQPHSNWPFSIIITLTLTSIVIILLISRKTIAYFSIQRTSHEK
jgi:hypothetical protein